MSAADSIKAQLRATTQKLLFDSCQEIEGKLMTASRAVSAVFQNSDPSPELGDADFANLQAGVETALGSALEDLTFVIQAAKDLQAGKLPS